MQVSIACVAGITGDAAFLYVRRNGETRGLGYSVAHSGADTVLGFLTGSEARDGSCDCYYAGIATCSGTGLVLSLK